MNDIISILKNIVEERTLIVTTGPPSGGSSFCNLNCTSVHLIPPHIAAHNTRTNPTVSNSTSPNAVKTSPAVINTPTSIRLHVTFSSPNINALSNTHIGLDDLTIVKNVIDMRTKDRFDNPISKAVTNPHGIETPLYDFYEEDVMLLVSQIPNTNYLSTNKTTHLDMYSMTCLLLLLHQKILETMKKQCN